MGIFFSFLDGSEQLRDAAARIRRENEKFFNSHQVGQREHAITFELVRIRRAPIADSTLMALGDPLPPARR